MLRRVILPVSLLAVLGLVVLWNSRVSRATSARATEDAADSKKEADTKEEGRDADRKAILALNKKLVAAFDKGDAKGLSGSWTATGEYYGTDGEPIRGRTAIEKAYSDFFAKNKGVRLEGKNENLRFLGESTAVETGFFLRKDQAGELLAACEYDLLLVKEKGEWLIAIARETFRVEAPEISGLDWLVGTWVTTGEGNTVETTYAFDEAKKFLHGKFSVKEKGKVVRTGLQIIGRDPAEGVLRSWVFDSDGGFGGGLWRKDDKGWAIDSAGTTSDGLATQATYLMQVKDKDTFIMQSTHRFLDGDPIPATEPVKVTRVKAGK